MASKPIANDELIGVPRLTEKTGLSRSTVRRYERDNNFPARVILGPGRVAWKLSEVNAWIESRQRATDREATA